MVAVIEPVLGRGRKKLEMRLLLSEGPRIQRCRDSRRGEEDSVPKCEVNALSNPCGEFWKYMKKRVFDEVLGT